MKRRNFIEMVSSGGGILAAGSLLPSYALAGSAETSMGSPMAQARELKELEVKQAIIDEGADLILAKIRRHPEEISVKELSGALKDIFGIKQVEAGQPTEITKLEDVNPHVVAELLNQLKSKPADSE